MDNTLCCSTPAVSLLHLLQEEEKRQRRLEKQLQEKERLQQHEAEQKAKEAELKKKLEEEDSAQKRAADRKVGRGMMVSVQGAAQQVNGDQLHRHLERLLAGTSTSNKASSGQQSASRDSSPLHNRPANR